MQRAAVLAVALGLPLLAAGAHAEQPPSRFVPPTERIEKPYTNDKCLDKCHGLEGFGAGSANGVLRDLHVDLQRYVFSTHGQKGIECVDCHADADPNAHPRAGYPRVDCRACHSEVPPPGVFPPDALKRLEAKGIKPPPKEARKGESWVKSKHGKAWEQANPAAPFCPQCHTAHYVRKSEDPESTVARVGLPATCGACHVDQVRSYDVGGALTRFRIGAHGKGDLSDRYSVCECLGCHQGEAAHGEEAVTEQRCPACHRVPEAKGETLYASLHIRPLASDQPVAGALRWLYGLGFWGVAGLGALLVLFLGFSTLYRRSDG